MQKTGRNDPCPCGSGKKYKHCCAHNTSTAAKRPSLPVELADSLDQARELMKAGRFGEAEIRLSQIAQAAPGFIEALNLAGQAALSQNNHVRAEFWLSQAINTPASDFSTWFNLGIAQYHLGKLDAAIASYRKAIGYKVEHSALAMVWYNLALAQHDLGLSDDAITSYGKSLELLPGRAETVKALGDVYFDLGNLDQALILFRKAVTLAPRLIPARNEIANVLKAQGKIGEAINTFRELVSIDPSVSEACSNLFFSMALDSAQKPADFLREHKRYHATFEQPIQAKRRPHKNLRDPARPLRIGYVSPDFRRHAVANFIEPILAYTSKEHFETYCYYNRADADGITERLRGYADQWRPCRQYSDEQLAEIIRMDEIDILVDLAGHTANNRLSMFAYKPAPLQITYLGYPGSSWLTAMDYRITDGYSDPPGSEQYYLEKLLRLPDSLFCYRPLDDMPEVAPSPCERNGYVTFGSFASFSKLDEQSLRLWVELMVRVPDARLLMLTIPAGLTQDRLRKRFADCGVSAERLILHGKLPRNEYLEKMHQADIALDPVMVNSPTTMCETLWMGLPTVSQFGERCSSRAGLSILSAAGLGHLASPGAEQYLSVAQTLASDPAALAKQRAALRGSLNASPLMNGKNFVAHLESIYRDIWKEWCAG